MCFVFVYVESSQSVGVNDASGEEVQRLQEEVVILKRKLESKFYVRWLLEFVVHYASVPQSENAVCAFQIPFKLLPFTIEDC